MIGGGHAAIDRLLQQYFLDVVGGEAALGERRAHMQAELVPLPERDHGADHQHPPRALVEMRPRPDLAPGVAGDEVLEVGVEGVAVRNRFVDPGIAQHLAALAHALIAAVLVVHWLLLSSLRGAKRRSNPEWCAWPWIASLRSQ